MTYAERALEYLWASAPEGATNAQIAQRLGATSHQTIYMLMQELLRRGLVRGEQQGRTWIFYAVDEQEDRHTPTARLSGSEVQTVGTLSPSAFETRAQRVLSERYAVELTPGRVAGVRKLFDFVSPDRKIVGDAKYYTRVRGARLPAAKFATIAEHVWLLEKTAAPTTFLVFGNEHEVPLLWLARYGSLATTVSFYFLSDDGQLELLAPAPC